MAKQYPDAQVGQPGPGQNEYVAGLNGARLTVYAPTAYAADQAAREFWKPLKKDAGYFWCRVVQVYGDAEPVVHVADF